MHTGIYLSYVLPSLIHWDTCLAPLQSMDTLTCAVNYSGESFRQ